MTTIVQQEAHTDAVIAALEAEGLRVGRGTDPDGAGWQGAPGTSDFHSYVVVFPMPGGNRHGPIGDPERDGQLDYQITCVAPDQQACERLVDRCSNALQRANVTVTGRKIISITHQDGAANVPRDDAPEPEAPSLFHATPRYRVWSVAA